MEKKIEIPKIYSLIVILVSLLGINCNVTTESRYTYIVHMNHQLMPMDFDQHTTWYASSLQSVSTSAEIMYTFKTVMHGFSTRLTSKEASKMEVQPGVVSVFREAKYELHTTRTPSFMDLPQDRDILPTQNVSQVIIGVLDTGIWPESPSLKDDDLRDIPIPESWKGECELGANFRSSNCNKKLIGARFFVKGHEAEAGLIDETNESSSPRDYHGHGTHTATTAAGSVVAGANLLGYANGTARGMATTARIASYKVCGDQGCLSTDIMQGFEKAIEDGVNVLSLSLGGGMPDYYNDAIAIGAFAAMEKGILVSCSAGNAGPSPYSLSNVAPWILTVGAGTIDRDFPALVKIENGTTFYGVSLYKSDSWDSKMYPLVYAKDVSNGTDGNLCLPGTLIPEKVEGKIVLCDRGINARAEKGYVVKAAGGAGMILANTEKDGEVPIADAHLLPATAVGAKAANQIKQYLSAGSNPKATILFDGTKLEIEPSPVVAAFSSRGPNNLTLEVLKPDVIAPGVNILAGWSGEVGPSTLVEDDRRVEFNIISGTSMSCPHVSGLAALLKAAHPDWSPAAIRSALMTTAYTNDKSGKQIQDASTGKAATPFAIGAGHVEPVAALDPGLVYDLCKEDYLEYLCAINYTKEQISMLANNDSFACDDKKSYSVNNLNYPSFAVSFKAQTDKTSPEVVKYTRTLTNVEPSGSTYKVSVYPAPKSVQISVIPQTLTFAMKNEKKNYTVTFSAASLSPKEPEFSRIQWSDGKHTVGSPVAISWD